MTPSSASARLAFCGAVLLAGAAGACRGSPTSAAVGTGGGQDGGASSSTIGSLQLGADVGCLLERGTLRCWGSNQDGALGNGQTDTSPHNIPEPAGGAQHFVDISVGEAQVCGVTDEGTGYCWGSIGYSCDGPCPPSPTPVHPELRLTMISAGRTGTCGLSEAGTAYCWGSNLNGGLGTIDDYSRTFNQLPGGPYKWIGSAQDNACALTAEGELDCWGLNVLGVLGRGAPPACSGVDCGTGGANANGMYAPQPVFGGHRFTSACVQAFNSCAVDVNGVAWCWGYNSDGCLGVGDTTDRNVPATFELPVGVQAQRVMCADPICVLSTRGDVYCAGDNRGGSLGLGTVDQNPHPTATLVPKLKPVALIGLSTVPSICVLTADGERYCWGENGGLLGDGTTINRPSPVLASP